jgi:Arm DNA-binding domain
VLEMAERETITAAPPRARQSNKLTARQIASAKPGRHGDGGGLYLVVSRTGARKWIFRFTSGGKPNEMGVGGAAVTLAQARDRAADARKFVASGINPITARREARMASAAKPTFGQCAEALLAAKSSEWRNARHRAQWRMTLETYAGHRHAARAASYCRAGSRICDPDGGSLWRSTRRALG